MHLTCVLRMTENCYKLKTLLFKGYHFNDFKTGFKVSVFLASTNFCLYNKSFTKNYKAVNDEKTLLLCAARAVHTAKSLREKKMRKDGCRNFSSCQFFLAGINLGLFSI